MLQLNSFADQFPTAHLALSMTTYDRWCVHSWDELITISTQPTFGHCCTMSRTEVCRSIPYQCREVGVSSLLNPKGSLPSFTARTTILQLFLPSHMRWVWLSSLDQTGIAVTQYFLPGTWNTSFSIFSLLQSVSLDITAQIIYIGRYRIIPAPFGDDGDNDDGNSDANLDNWQWYAVPQELLLQVDIDDPLLNPNLHTLDHTCDESTSYVPNRPHRSLNLFTIKGISGGKILVVDRTVGGESLILILRFLSAVTISTPSIPPDLTYTPLNDAPYAKAIFLPA